MRERVYSIRAGRLRDRVPPRAVVPNLVLKGVVEDEAFATDPRPLLVPDADLRAFRDDEAEVTSLRW